MDQQKLRALVFEKTGVKIDIDDPVFALVALNEAVLAEAVERHVALLDDATADLADQTDALLEAGGGCRYGAGERAPAALLRPDPAPGAGPSAADQRIMAIAAGAAVLCALLVLCGQALLFSPPAAQLTPAQAQAIARADKLDHVLQKLDPTTRNAIVAEMQKP